MDFFTEKFEEYPFSNEKYGHAQFGWGGGMEHTTVSFMGNFSRGLIAHELAHQWFGNKIIRARLHSFDLAFLGTFRGQNNDWNMTRLRILSN